jgi:mono/diheme cytochrome c family protein
MKKLLIIAGLTVMAAAAQTRLNVAAFTAFVRNPPSGGMPPYRAKIMTDQELADVFAYIQTFPAPQPAKNIPLLNE